MDSPQDPNRLSTWKEIAAFLGCDVRTCLRWEKERGLPVHRPEGGSKSRVYAWKDELEAWLKGNAKTSGPGFQPAAVHTETENAKSEGRRPGKMHPLLLAAAVIALAAGLFFGYREIFFDRTPADFHIRGSVLQIVNKDGEHLWKYDTKLHLAREEKFRPYFNGKGREESEKGFDLPLIIIRDIDGDGKNEVLFTPRTQSSFGGGRVSCFDYRGNERWGFDGGRELAFGGLTYSRDYWCEFDVDDFNGDGRNEILVFAAHAPEWPTQVVLLSLEGKLLGEYWHSGRILDYLSADLNGDGKKELVLCGTNNEYRQGILAVFDPDRFGGSSPNSGQYRCPDLSAGTELAYLILPKTDIDPVEPKRDWLNFSVLPEMKSGLIYVITMENRIYFEIDPKTLACRNIGLTTQFKVYHEAAVKAGRASSVLDDRYSENLRTSIEYWTGSAWTTTPTWIR